MRPIFNEKVTEKWYLWVREQYMDALFKVEKSTKPALKKRKKSWKRKRKTQKLNPNQAIREGDLNLEYFR